MGLRHDGGWIKYVLKYKLIIEKRSSFDKVQLLKVNSKFWASEFMSFAAPSQNQPKPCHMDCKDPRSAAPTFFQTYSEFDFCVYLLGVRFGEKWEYVGVGNRKEA